MIDQTTPYGSVNWQQMGAWADGTPKFSNTVTLSPQEQAKQEQQWEFDNLTNQLGINQTKKLTGVLDTPFKLGNEATEGRLMELGMARLNPQFDRRRAALENSLYNKGFREGDEGFKAEMEKLGQQENDAINQLLLTGRGQANQEMLTERNQPINETTALMAGGQVQQPNFMGTPQTNVAGTDIAGLTMDAYKLGPLAQWQQQNADRQAMMGGMFSLAAAPLGGWARAGFAKPTGWG